MIIIDLQDDNHKADVGDSEVSFTVPSLFYEAVHYLQLENMQYCVNCYVRPYTCTVVDFSHICLYSLESVFIISNPQLSD